MNTVISRPYKTYTFKLCPAVRPSKPPYARRTHSLSDYILTGYGPVQRRLPQLLLSVENGPPEATKAGKFRILCVGIVRFKCVGFVRSRNNCIHYYSAAEVQISQRRVARSTTGWARSPVAFLSIVQRAVLALALSSPGT